MSRTLTGEQVRDRAIAGMGTELGTLFTVIATDFTWLYCRWSQYVKLFGGKSVRLAILNNSAPAFFWIIQQTLWHDTLLGISRLAGPERTMGKQNVSVRRFAHLIADAEMHLKVEAILQRVVDASAFAKDWRDRHIAHRDLDLALGREVEPLAAASRDAVDAALESIADLLNVIEQHYVGVTTIYRHSPLIRDADELVHVLRDGLRREEIRRARLQAGEYRPEDWNDDAPAV